MEKRIKLNLMHRVRYVLYLYKTAFVSSLSWKSRIKNIPWNDFFMTNLLIEYTKILFSQKIKLYQPNQSVYKCFGLKLI